MIYSKKRWLNEIIESLKEIASEEFQEKGWVKGEIHDYCRFAGTICGIYEYAHLEDFIDNYAKKFELSDQQIQKLDQLRHALNAYVDKNGCYEEPEIILKDQEWHKIRQLAQECLRALHVEKYLDPSKDIPKKSLLYSIYHLTTPKSLERIWIEERKQGTNPFLESMDKFFHDPAYKTKDIIEHFRDYEVTEEQQRCLVKLYDVLKTYWEKKKNEENLRKILDDPEWHQIQSLAKEVLTAFDFELDED